MSTVNSRRGFSLIESLAAVVVVTIGIVGSLSALSAIEKGEARAKEVETMQRLAIDKYDELVATGQATTSQSGDFTDRNETRFTWKIDVNASGVTSLQAITVTVETAQPSSDAPRARVDGLLYVPPQTGATTGTSVGGAAGGRS